VDEADFSGDAPIGERTFYVGKSGPYAVRGGGGLIPSGTPLEAGGLVD